MNILQSLLVVSLGLVALQTPATDAFKVVAFYTGINDVAHVSFVKEANKFFPDLATSHGFVYESTNNWGNLNDNFLADVDVILFLDTRPEDSNQRSAFERYARNGGGFLGFHFAAFALTPSDYPQNWNWYHNEFLGSGQYVSNTWKPTPAVLRNEMPTHGAMGQTPHTFTSAANEWYRWEHDLTKNPAIDILLAIDEASFPLGTNPSETWYSGYYPVVWSNKNYNMVYWNMGHNDIDYGNGNADLSHTFDNANQVQLVIDCIYWMAYKSQAQRQQRLADAGLRFKQHLYGAQ